jgi:hypothetical protein
MTENDSKLILKPNDIARRLEQHPKFEVRSEMRRNVDGFLDLEHPGTLGWLVATLLRMAEGTTVSAERIDARSMEWDGRVRVLEPISVPVDDEERQLLGSALGLAILLWWERGWDSRFDDSLSAHSLGAEFMLNAHR